MKTSLFQLVLCLNLFNLSGLSVAEIVPSPPDSSNEPIDVKATVPTDFARSFVLGTLEVIFEETTLGEVEAIFGPAAAGRSGDASTSQHWLCYSLPKQLIWFISGEMGGTNDRITQLQAFAVEPNDPRLDRCPAIPAR